LFSPSRRQPPPPEPPPPDPAPIEAAELPEVTVVGVALHADRRSALLRDASGSRYWVDEGGRIGGWTVARIDRRGLEAQTGELTAYFPLGGER
jgi:hypothetical protein